MVRRAGLLSSLVILGLFTGTGPARVQADTVDKLTYLTFSGNFQIPGARLNAGTYRFRLADPTDARNVIQVLSYDGSTVYAMFHTIPDSRTTVTDEATVTFRETPSGVPPAVKSLFYGGEHRGYEFVYPAGEPIMTAIEIRQPDITYTPRATAAIETSDELRDAFDRNPAVEIAPQADVFENSAAAAVQQPVTELPRTAGLVPLVAVGGLGSLLVGLGFGLIRRFVS